AFCDHSRAFDMAQASRANSIQASAKPRRLWRAGGDAYLAISKHSSAYFRYSATDLLIVIPPSEINVLMTQVKLSDSFTCDALLCVDLNQGETSSCTLFVSIAPAS